MESVRGTGLRWIAGASLIAAAALAAHAIAPAAASASACTRFGDSAPRSISLVNAERSVLCLVNRQRTRLGLRALSGDRRLAHAAAKHSKRMRGGDCFAHQCPSEASPKARLMDVNYLIGGLLNWSYGENIAWGADNYGTPQNIVSAWMHSPEHRANILHPAFRDAGVGIVWGTIGHRRARGGVFTMDFGSRVP
jgi:uncharacterized protein YkwD